ncbi:DUF6751 family protein [Clostridium sp. DL1XJH146]
MAVLVKNSDITIYNKYYNKGIDSDGYQRSIIEGVNWQGKRNATVGDKGLNFDDSVIIFINKIDNYTSPKSFKKLSDIEKPNYVTFAIGDKVVKGQIDFEIMGIKPYRVTDLENNYDDVSTIMSVRELSGHWEVECK